MHSSGMRTARLLTVSKHALGWGCVSQHALGRGVSAWGVSAWGGSAQGVADTRCEQND